MNEDQFPVACRQTIVDNNVHPFSKMPELEVEDASIAITPALLDGDHLHIVRQNELYTTKET